MLLGNAVQQRGRPINHLLQYPHLGHVIIQVIGQRQRHGLQLGQTGFSRLPGAPDATGEQVRLGKQARIAKSPLNGSGCQALGLQRPPAQFPGYFLQFRRSEPCGLGTQLVEQGRWPGGAEFHGGLGRPATGIGPGRGAIVDPLQDDILADLLNLQRHTGARLHRQVGTDGEGFARHREQQPAIRAGVHHQRIQLLANPPVAELDPVISLVNPGRGQGELQLFQWAFTPQQRANAL